MIVIPENVIFNQLEVLIENVWKNHKTVVSLGSVVDADDGTSGFNVVTTQQGSVGVAEITTLVTVADVGGSLSGMYFMLNTPSSEWYFWFNTGSSLNPDIQDKISVVVNIAEDDDAETVASKLNDVINMYPIWFTSTVDTDELTITCVETDARRRGLLYAMFGSNQLDRLNYYDQMVKMLEDRYNAQKRRFGIYVGWNPSRTTTPSVSIMLPNEEGSPRRASTTTSVKNLNYEGGKTIEKTHSYAATYDILLTSDNENEVVLLYHFLKSLVAIGDMQFNSGGLQNMSITGRDITTDFDLMPRLVYHRTVGLNFHYDNSLPSFESFVNATSVIVNGGLVVNINPVTNYVTIVNGAGRVLRITQLSGIVDLGYITFTDSDGQVSDVPVGDNVTATPNDCAENETTVNTTPYASAPSGTPINVEVEDTTGTDVGSLVSGKWQIANSPIKSTGVAFTDSVESEQPYIIADVPWTDSDGTPMSSEYGTGIVCTAGGGATLTIEVYLDAALTIPYVSGVDFQDDIWIHINTDLDTPTEYRFLIFDQGLNGTHVVQAGDTLQWNVRTFSGILTYAEAVNGSSAACALSAFEVEINADVDANAYIAAHNALSGMIMGAHQQLVVQGTYQRLKGVGTTYGSDLWTLFKNSGTRIFGYTPVDDSTVNTLAYGLDMIQLASQTFHGFVPPDFAVTGLKGGSGKYTKTGMYATGFGINELGGSVYIRENTPTGSVFGATDGINFFNGTNGMLLFIRTVGQNNVAVRSNSVYGYISPFATRTGLIGMQRTSSSLVGAYRNGVLIDTVSVSVSSQNAGEIYGHACNHNGTNGENYTGEIAWLCPAMPRLTANQMADYYEAVKYYQENIITGGRHVV